MKGKKLLAGILSAAMVLGTMSFNVLAEEVNNTESNIQLMNAGSLDSVTMEYFDADNEMFDEGKKAEGFSLTLHNIPSGTTDMKVEVWHEETKLSTTTYKKNDELVGTISVRIVVAGDADISSSWETELHEADWYDKTPNTVKVKAGENEKIISIRDENFAGAKYPKMEVAKKKVAKIGEETYSIEKALAVATADDTIELCDDVTYNKHVSGANRVTNAKALDLNGKTLALPDYDYNFGEITISNGTIESTKTDRAQGTALIFQCDKDSITFDGVTINTNDLSADGYVIGTNGGECIFKNSTINVNPTTATEIASLFSPGDHTSTSNLVIEDSEINVSNASTKIALWGNVEIKGSSKINADLTDNDGIRLNNYGSFKVTATTDDEGNVKAPEINITTTGSNRYGINIADVTEYSVDSNAKVNASVYRTPSASNIAEDEIKLSFEDVTVNAGEKVYDLYFEAASDKTINRLTAADLTFDLTNDSENITPISYEIFGTDKVTVQSDNANSNKYLFYFNGLTAPSGTGVKVKVGQVKFNGYGKFGFKAIAGEAHATSIDGENVVTDFVAENQAEDQGKLDISNELTAVEITIPTKKLTVNVTFPNAVVDNAKEYQDMKITVVGGTVNETYKLGTDGVAMADGKYVVTTNLPENTPYTVEVSGAGYRTARYTVTMNANKTLNFWNNVKDTAIEVEEGNEAIKKNVTFLAGELVNDGKINIYDLSAVVSYFGASNDVNEASDYAKYDLNRDGKIDSKDIAYVLVSWSK